MRHIPFNTRLVSAHMFERNTAFSIARTSDLI